ncbi:MAG: HEAT repeat domain-containing protein [Verrucomicrobiota bacterium]
MLPVQHRSEKTKLGRPEKRPWAFLARSLPAWSRIGILCFSLASSIQLPPPRAGEDVPVIGKIDLYGLRKVPADVILRAVPLHPGDRPTTGPFDAVERQLEAVPGVTKAKVAIVCCDDAKTLLFVGIQEDGAASFSYNPAPRENVALVPAVRTNYDSFMDILARAVRAGNSLEDDSAGHAIFAGDEFKPVQERFLAQARAYQDELKRVLRSSARAGDRAIAAWVLGYAADKRQVVDDLLHAVRDPDDLVRNNATRALGAIAALARAKPELGIRIDPAIFLEMLHALTWSDRNKATMVLEKLTENRPADLLQQLRREALPELAEMARWQATHSLTSLLLLGRIVGVPDDEVRRAWKEGRRGEIIERSLRPG